jgi:hypothetical protein
MQSSFYNFPEPIFCSTSIIWALWIWTKGLLPVSPNNEVLLYMSVYIFTHAPLHTHKHEYVMKHPGIFDVKLCSLLKVYWCTRGNCYCHLHC